MGSDREQTIIVKLNIYLSKFLVVFCPKVVIKSFSFLSQKSILEVKTRLIDRDVVTDRSNVRDVICGPDLIVRGWRSYARKIAARYTLKQSNDKTQLGSVKSKTQTP